MSAAGTQRVLGQLQGGNAEERIEVITRQTGQHAPVLEVRALRWGAGIGWYTYKTLTLSPTEATRLAHLLRRFSSAAHLKPRGAKVLPLRKRRT